MNPRLDLLHPYPFEKLKALLAQAPATSGKTPINLSIGEPKHAAPQTVKQAIMDNMAGLSEYPPTKGTAALRQTIASWLARRYGIPTPNPETQVLPVLGSREALFSLAQALIDPISGGYVISPNPFYQIYEGAALLAGAQPYYLNLKAGEDPDWASVPGDIWSNTRMVFVCSPGNPTGQVMTLDGWRALFDLSAQHNFVIISDECYSEIYPDEDNPPLGGLQAAQLLGVPDYRNLICCSSLSKRSNVPGLRSGFVAGDAKLLAPYLLYRTYHGCAMSPVVSAASIAAWSDETHVLENRALYRAKFEAVVKILGPVMDVQMPDAAFYLWAPTPGSDVDFARDLYAEEAITVLPGSFLARDAHRENPGQGRVRMALVAPLEACVEGAHRIAEFLARRAR